MIKIIENLRTLDSIGVTVQAAALQEALQIVQGTDWYVDSSPLFMPPGRTQYVLEICQILNPELFFSTSQPPVKGDYVDRMYGPYDDEDLTDRDAGLQLLRLKNTSLTPIQAATPNLSRGLTLYYGLLVRAGKDKIFTDYDVLDWAKRENWKEGFEWIQGHAFKAGFEDYEYITNLLTLNGWVDVDLTDDEAIYEESVNWFSTPVEHEWDGSVEEWRKEWDLAFDRLFSSTLSGRSPKKLTMQEYLSDPLNWGRTGSSYDPYNNEKFYCLVPEYLYDTKNENILKVNVQGKKYIRVKVGNSKWASAFAYDPEVLREALSRPDKAYSRAFWKRAETKKQRSIVSSDLYTYLIMDFIEKSWTAYCFKNDNRSTLWMSKEQTWKMWNRFSKIEDEVAVPLDQSSFDAMQGKWEVMRLLWKFLDYAPEHIVEWLRLLIYRLDNMEIIIPQTKGEDKNIKYNNGVPSGLRWTAFFDTLLNLITNELVREKLERQALPKQDQFWVVAQGDDDLLRVKDYRYASSLWFEYTKMGYIIHPGKFFISTTRDEFLRKMTTNNHDVKGYAPRAINSILWRNPENTPQPRSPERLAGIAAKWKICYDRLALGLEKVKDLMMVDLVGTSGASYKDVESWIYTPRAKGGFGQPYPVENDILTTGRRVTPNVYSFRGVRYESKPGIERIISNAEELTLTTSFKDTNDFVLSTIDQGKFLKYRERIKTSELELTDWKEFVGKSILDPGLAHTWDISEVKKKKELKNMSKYLGIYSMQENIEKIYPRPSNCTKRLWRDFILAGERTLSVVRDGVGVEFTSYQTVALSKSILNWVSHRRRANIDVYEDMLATQERVFQVELDWTWVQ